VISCDWFADVVELCWEILGLYIENNSKRMNFVVEKIGNESVHAFALHIPRNLKQ
jgi:hypothetical protein